MDPDVEEQLEQLEQRVTVLEDNLEFRLEEIEQRMSELEDETADSRALRRELENLKAEFRARD